MVMKQCLVTKYVGVELSGETRGGGEYQTLPVFNMFDHLHQNEKSVLQFLIKCLSTFEFYRRRSNAIKQGV